MYKGKDVQMSPLQTSWPFMPIFKNYLETYFVKEYMIM